MPASLKSCEGGREERARERKVLRMCALGTNKDIDTAVDIDNV
jgi:hypothetical protein